MTSTCRCTPQKVRYRDEIAAKLALASVQRADGSRRAKTEKRAYHCPCCNGWHLTAKSGRKRENAGSADE